MWRSGASDAMGISASAVCRRGLLNACVGSDQGYDDPGWPVAIGRTGVARARSTHTTAIAGGARSRLIIAGRDSAKQRCSAVILPRADLDHDVSILIAAVDAAGRVRGEAPRWNLSMMIMRPPQHGHGCASSALVWAQLVSPALGCAAGTSSKRRARAMLSARVALADRP